MAAAGGLGPARPDQHYEPPAGGQAITGARGVVRARQVIISGGGPPGSGLFVYSPAVAAGDLLASITAAAGHDTPGNAIPSSGVFSYGKIGSTWFAIGLHAGGLEIFSATSEAGPWTQAAIIQGEASGFGLVIQTSGTGDIAMEPGGNFIVNALSQFDNTVQIFPGPTNIGLQINGGNNNAIGAASSSATLATADLQQSGAGNPVITIEVTGDTNPRLIIDSNGAMTWGTGAAAGDTTLARVGTPGLDLTIGVTNQNALSVSNATGTNAGRALVQLTTGTAPATDRAIGLQAAADTSERLRIDTLPAIHFGPGNASPDCTFARAAPGELASDYIAYSNNGGTTETWQVPTFANGWANAAQGPNLQYRRIAAPYNSIQWVGRIVAPAGVVVGQTITTSPTAPYHPADIGDIIAWDTTQSAIVLLRIGTGGALSYQGGVPIGNGDVITIPAGNGIVSLDA